MTPTRTLDLTVERWDLAVCQLPEDAPIPEWASHGTFQALLRTPGEVTVICDAAIVPDDVRSQKHWRCFSLKGPIPFTETGVLSSIAVPLAAAGIGIFVLSTFDTDYVLVAGRQLDDATKALAAAGHRITSR